MVPMQFSFITTPVWLIDMGVFIAQNTSNFSNIAALYIDNTNSSHDINILFPDTGFQTRVNFGNTALIPILTSNVNPRFYVILDSSGATSSTDMCNIFALNQFVPAWGTTEFQRVVSYGYSSLFQLQPTFTQSESFNIQSPDVNDRDLITANQWFVTSLDIDLVASSAPDGIYQMDLLDATDNSVWKSFLFVLTGTGTYHKLISLAGLNKISKGGGSLVSHITSPGGIANIDIAFNIDGGILVP